MTVVEERHPGFHARWGRTPRTDLTQLIPATLRRDPALVQAEREQQARAARIGRFTGPTATDQQRKVNARQASSASAKAAAARRAQPTLAPRTRTCTACGNQFDVPYQEQHKRYSRATTCSLRCREQAAHGGPRMPAQRSRPATCKVCGGEYQQAFNARTKSYSRAKTCGREECIAAISTPPGPRDVCARGLHDMRPGSPNVVAGPAGRRCRECKRQKDRERRATTKETAA